MMDTLLFQSPCGGTVLRGILDRPRERYAGRMVVCVAGFESSATTAPKFRALSRALVERGHSVLRLDFAGCGLSDGEYSKTTVADLAAQLHSACDHLHHSRLCFAAHNLGACVVLRLLASYPDIKPEKTLFLSPALDQAALLRYWWLLSLGVDRETARAKSRLRDFVPHYPEGHETKANRMAKDYYEENLFEDYHRLLGSVPDLFTILTEDDPVVPGWSVGIDRDRNFLSLSTGDHHNEKPSLLARWLDQAVSYLAG